MLDHLVIPPAGFSSYLVHYSGEPLSPEASPSSDTRFCLLFSFPISPEIPQRVILNGGPTANKGKLSGHSLLPLQIRFLGGINYRSSIQIHDGFNFINLN